MSALMKELQDEIIAKSNPVTMDKIKELQEENFAEEVKIFDRMIFWTEQEVEQYFASGGMDAPKKVLVASRMTAVSKTGTSAILIVQTCWGKEFQINIPADGTVLVAKMALAELGEQLTELGEKQAEAEGDAIPIPGGQLGIEDMRLVFGGRSLDDADKLETCDIKSGSIIYLLQK